MIVCLFFDLPFVKPVLFQVPDKLKPKIILHGRVVANVQGASHTSFVYDILLAGDPKYPTTLSRIEAIHHIVDKEAILNKEQLAIAVFLADYYICTLGEAIFRILPAGKNMPSSNVLVKQNIPIKASVQSLLEQQKQVLSDISTNMSKRKKNAPYIHLIFGITGSGKTRLYLELINQKLCNQEGVILMLPEIALSYQFLDILSPYYGDQMVLLHSNLTVTERLTAYMKLKKGEVFLAVGTRSTIFAPICNLSLVIIDEEHDQSYKESQKPYYHTKTIAWFRLNAISKETGIDTMLILGSATPSLESYYLAKQSVIGLSYLRKRATQQPLPHIHTISHNVFHSSASIFSLFLIKKIEHHLQANKQIILLLNRRGYSHFVFCKTCKSSISCSRCSITMTYHQSKSGKGGAKSFLQCHLCGLQKNYVTTCASCRSPLTLMGKGIQKVEDALDFHFPEIPYARIDQNTARTKNYVPEILEAFRNKEIRILIGTQMLAKGFDLPGVTLVGIVNADIGLNLPDFRCMERIAQLLTQTAGRAGRHEAGEVVMQTMQSDNPAIQLSTNYQYEEFMQYELKIRKLMFYPPYCKMIRILISSQKESTLLEMYSKLNHLLHHEVFHGGLFSNHTAIYPHEILGPVEAPIYKIKNMYRYHVLFKDLDHKKLRLFAKEVAAFLDKLKHKHDFLYSIDVDPVDLL